MNELALKAETETRAFTEEEQAEFDGYEKEIRSIDSTMKSLDSARDLGDVEVRGDEKEESQEDIDIRAFASIIRQRGDSNITKTDNGAVIPSTIVNKIIDKVVEISPLFAASERFNIKGKVQIPYVDASNDAITVAYATEFTDLEAKSTKLLTIELAGHLAGVLCKISKSLLNNTDLDLTNWVIAKMARNIAIFVDGQILKPTLSSSSPYAPTEVRGLYDIDTTNMVVTAASTSAVTMDELITLRDKLKSEFQKNAFWVMSPATLDAIRHLKDGDNRYYVLDDVTNDFGVSLFGKPIYTTDQIDNMGASKYAIYYGDFSQGLASKLVEDSVQLLTEKYATQHALGIVAYMEFDCRIQNAQAIAGLKMAAS
jgi:HK97 family phage major capsid protein